MSVKGPWCNWSRLNGPLKHGKGGVTRCPAMMSSIGPLCGSQPCHSFIPPGVCCLSHPSTKAIAKTWLVETCTQTWKSLPAHLDLSWLCYSYSKYSRTTLILILTHTLWWAHTPWKIPKPFTSSARYTVHSHSLAFTRWNIPKKRGKTPGHHKFLFFFTLLFPFAPFH